MSSVPSVVPTPVASSLQGSTSSSERDLRRHLIYSGVFWGFSLCILSGFGSVCLFPSAAEGNFSDDGWIRRWFMNIEEYNQESFYWYFFFWPIVFDFTLGLGYLLSDSWLSKQYCVPSHGVGIKSSWTLISYFYTLCATVALAYFSGRTDCRSKGLCLHFSFVSMQSASCTKDTRTWGEDSM